MDNVAFTIFGLNIYWYGIIIAVGLMAGVLIGLREAKRRGFRSEMVLDFILLAIPLCIVCARLYYVAFEWESFASDPVKIFYIREGGLAIYGGVIGGVIAAVIFYYWRRVSMGEMLDIAAPGLIIGQAIGRWGNFMNQEAFGRAVTNPSLQWFPFAVYIEQAKRINGVIYDPGYYYATFFYEFIWNLIVFTVLMLLRKKIKIRGGIFALYIALYGVGRFWIEQLRTDSLMWNGYRVSQGLSELLVIGGIAYLLYMYFSKKDFYAYSGYYSLDLTEEQLEAMKGKNALLNAQQDLKKAQWFADMVRENSLTSPRYRAVKQKAESMSETARSLRESLGEDNQKAAAAQKKADALTEKAAKIYAQIKLEGRLEIAQKDADNASKLVESLKQSDPEGQDLLAAQHKAELASLLVEKIKDNMDEDKKSREEWLEKADLNIAVLEDKVRREEERLEEKAKKTGGAGAGNVEKPTKDESPEEKTAEQEEKPAKKSNKSKEPIHKDEEK